VTDIANYILPSYLSVNSQVIIFLGVLLLPLHCGRWTIFSVEVFRSYRRVSCNITAFPLQQWLRERALVLLYTCIAGLVYLRSIWC